MQIDYIYSPALINTNNVEAVLCGLHQAEQNEQTLKKILAMAQQELLNQTDPNTYRFALSSRWVPASLLQVPPSQISSVKPTTEINRYTNFDVFIKQGGSTRRMQIQLSVQIEKMLPVASQRIINGQVIDASQIDYQWVTVSGLNNNLVESRQELLGKIIRRTLTIGQPIRFADLASEFIIHAGDEVTMLYNRHGVEILIKTEARQNGEYDEVITLYSNENRTRYLGRVISRDKVKWEKTL